MHTFTDNAGREWRLLGNFGNYRRVHADTGVRLDDIGTENRKSLEQLSDAFTLGAVLWSMVEPEAEGRGVTPEQFAEAIDGTVLDKAYEALLEEMIFFCRPRMRQVLEMALRKVREADGKIQAAAAAAIQAAEKEVDAAIDQLILGSSVLNSPESSACTPTNGASESSSGPPPANSGSLGTTPAVFSLN